MTQIKMFTQFKKPHDLPAVEVPLVNTWFFSRRATS